MSLLEDVENEENRQKLEQESEEKRQERRHQIIYSSAVKVLTDLIEPDVPKLMKKMMDYDQTRNSWECPHWHVSEHINKVQTNHSLLGKTHYKVIYRGIDKAYISRSGYAITTQLDCFTPSQLSWELGEIKYATPFFDGNGYEISKYSGEKYSYYTPNTFDYIGKGSAYAAQIFASMVFDWKIEGLKNVVDWSTGNDIYERFYNRYMLNPDGLKQMLKEEYKQTTWSWLI